MNKNLIFKEWKEKLWVPIFALVFLVLFAIAAVVFAKHGDILDYLTGGIQIFFLPLIGVLLGASAFSAEFKDGSWAYLFSRPIKKSSIWISKFAALAGLLAAVVVVTYIVLPLIPGFKVRLAEAPLWGLSLFISFSVYIASYSLAYISEKPVPTFFLTLFIFAAFSVLAGLLIKALAFSSFTSRSLQDVPFLVIIFTFLGVLALGAASLYAFCRTDFSNPKSMISGFLKSLVVFLAIGTVVGTAAYKIDLSSDRGNFLFLRSAGKETLIHSNRGIFRFDPAENRLIKLKGPTISFSGNYAEPGGGKIAWTEASLSRNNRSLEFSQRLWIMDRDGRNKRMILKTTHKPDSPLKGRFLSFLSLSPDGRSIVFLVYPAAVPGPSEIWTMNSDGTGLRVLPALPDADARFFYIRHWTSEPRTALVSIMTKRFRELKRREKGGINRYGLLSTDTGEWRLLPYDVTAGLNTFGLSPDGGRLGYFAYEGPEPEASMPVIRIIDLKNLEATDVLSLPGIQIAAWNPQGDQIAFLADSGRRLGVVSISGKEIVAERVRDFAESYRDIGTLIWTEDAKNIVLADTSGSGYVLRMYDPALAEEKTYSVPQDYIPLENHPRLYRAGDKILVLNFPASRLWSFDPATEKWKKLL